MTHGRNSPQQPRTSPYINVLYTKLTSSPFQICMAGDPLPYTTSKSTHTRTGWRKLLKLCTLTIATWQSSRPDPTCLAHTELAPSQSVALLTLIAHGGGHGSSCQVSSAIFRSPRVTTPTNDTPGSEPTPAAILPTFTSLISTELVAVITPKMHNRSKGEVVSKSKAINRYARVSATDHYKLKNTRIIRVAPTTPDTSCVHTVQCMNSV